ncbi:tetratricopeptide repeat protein [Spirochaeta thermophila]|uniref:tetratricopeptide repeat protein n=1 Tax=Winmispira thermophila TaxID=154 RepID=UPI0003003F01|nr:tetratricopeptide repeat protein [Spirochaeta thermophila]
MVELLQPYSSSHHPPLLLLYAKSAILAGHPDLAIPPLTRLLKLSPSHTDARIWLIRAHIARGDLTTAKHLLLALLPLNREDPRLAYLEGLIAEKEGRLQDAILSYHRAALFETELAKTYVALGGLYFRFLQYEKAREYIEKAHSILPPEHPLSRPLTELTESLNLSRSGGTPP